MAKRSREQAGLESSQRDNGLEAKRLAPQVPPPSKPTLSGGVASSLRSHQHGEPTLRRGAGQCRCCRPRAGAGRRAGRRQCCTRASRSPCPAAGCGRARACAALGRRHPRRVAGVPSDGQTAGLLRAYEGRADKGVLSDLMHARRLLLS